MPDEIVRAVQAHHDLEGAPEEHRRDAALVALADLAAKEVAPPRLPQVVTADERARVLGALELPAQGFERYVEAVRLRFARLGAAY
jgi:hypothetical protein